MPARSRFEGWPVVGWAALATLALATTPWLAGGGGEPAVRALIRLTARVSVVLFLLAFTASALRRVWPNPATAWLLRNRRYVGVSFAVSHLLHAAAIAVLAARWPHPFRETEGRTEAVVGGGLAYLFIVLMTATSFDGAVARLGPRLWKRLHVVGIHYVWLIFTLAHARRAALAPWYTVVTVALLLALALRLGVAWRRAPSRAFDGVPP